MRSMGWKASLCVFLFLGATQCSVSGRVAESARPAKSRRGESAVIYLPGISGLLAPGKRLGRELHEGGFAGSVSAFDWTDGDPGLDALHATARNKAQAKKLAARMAGELAANPRLHLYLIAHSGGAAIAAWALADLPKTAKVEGVVLLAPALSPGYDLTAALEHVRGRMTVFYSDRDWWVSGAGTKLLGTMDGVRTESAGLVGFHEPSSADGEAYAKLVQIPYNPAWGELGNPGDHMGPLAGGFIQAVVAPLLSDVSPASK